MSDRWETILAIFDAVRHAPADEQRELLADRCGSDSGLRAEVESLLENDSRADADFLRPKEIGEWRVGEADPLIGASIAGYTIKEPIARGGMGTVYLAEQKSTRREVALKVLHTGYWSSAIAKRFEVESRILGHLRHPNIAQVYDAGTHRLETGATPGTEARRTQVSGLRTQAFSIHYFAMEYVPNARVITKYADEHSLTQKARLELFLQLCDAVAYGHQKGVIHRDLKPANILVGSEGPRVQGVKGDEVAPQAPQDSGLKSHASLKVIDFGIARTVDSDIAATTMHTEAGQLLGTLAYMSPEQCAADPSQIDTTTDIYSLGVILYELLTGRMPYDVSNMTIQSAARIICEQEPRRPSTFARSGTGFQPVKGDLETIILKAIDKNRVKRYQSVSDLSNDIRRLISGEPISARPPTAYSRMLRWAARRPKAAAVVAGVFIALAITGTSSISISYYRNSPAYLKLTCLGDAFDPLGQRETRRGNLAQLISSSSEVLHQWNTPRIQGIRCALMLQRPGFFGDVPVVAIGYEAMSGDEHRGHLCLFDARSGELIWKKTVDQACIAAMPDSAWPRPDHAKGRQYHSEDFGVAHGWAFDIFDDAEHPGNELVVFHQHSGCTQGVLRVYDLNGTVLYSAWQDGGISEVEWLPAEKLLICVAPKADRDEIALDNPSESQHPKVIFAISPSLNGMSTGWILPYNPDGGNAKWEMPVWYRTFCPKEFACGWLFIPMLCSSQQMPSQFDPAHHAVVTLRANPDKQYSSVGGLVFIIDSAGEIVDHMPLSDSARQYFDSHPEAPEPKEIELVEWTSPVFPCILPATTTSPVSK